MILETLLKYKNSLLNVAIVTCLFLISLPVRLPFINLTMGDYHEGINAHALIALENLNNRSFKEHLFRNIQTYPGEQNSYINWVTTRLMDDKGISYYTSYPPFGIILPFIVFKILSLEFTNLNLQLFNIFLHYVSSIFLFNLVFHLTKKSYQLLLSTIAVAYHIFLSLNLWFFTTTYSWDILWYYLFIISLWFLYKYLSTQGGIQNIHFISFGLFLFLTTFTDFQGLFFAFFIIVFCLFNYRKKEYKKLIFATIASCFFAVVITFLQNSTINGPKEYIEIMLKKVFIEYGTLGEYNKNYDIKNEVFKHYKNYFSEAFYLLFSLFFLFFIKAVKNKNHERILNYQEIILLGSAISPLMLHHILILSDAVHHEFALLKFSIILSIAIPLFLSKFHRNNLLIFTFCLLSIYPLYKSIYLFLSFYPKKDDRSYYIRSYYMVGKIIKDFTKSNEIAFSIGIPVITPQIVYYAQRNIQEVPTIDHAISWLKENNKQKGRVFIFDEDKLPKKIISISPYDSYEEIEEKK